MTVNFPQPELWRSIEAIGDTTGKYPVPATKLRGTVTSPKSSRQRA